MKNLNITITTSILLLSLSACSSKTATSPSQNEALNSVTNTTAQKEKDGIMQRSMDSWIKDEWTPKTQKDEKVKTLDKDESRDFKIQEYVDKSQTYLKDSDAKETQSHTKKVNSLPVIGN
ncbi:MAG: hypothetical protein JJW00_06665 [Sulfurimonas sp.]|nr:hypothetical protein [Sulfurimonas sp.]